MVDEQQLRTVPNSSLDLNFLLTNSAWGSQEVSPDLKKKLTKAAVTDENGNEVVTEESLWGILNYYTRDMRLGNLDKSELDYCRHYIQLAGDYLSVPFMVEPFIICLSRAASILETSQSKGGFLRRIINTLRSENVSQQIEPPKKAFFGGPKPGGNV